MAGWWLVLAVLVLFGGLFGDFQRVTVFRPAAVAVRDGGAVIVHGGVGVAHGLPNQSDFDMARARGGIRWWCSVPGDTYKLTRSHAARNTKTRISQGNSGNLLATDSAYLNALWKTVQLVTSSANREMPVNQMRKGNGKLNREIGW
ncbi:hypothetical protein [Saccharopolyspora sp. NPDC049426]|uniref:hypothetical protein n=1 Tax=Saccharopolyspora sp. NPDC049426 TaxID=3155652 RepID=UPI0034350449